MIERVQSALSYIPAEDRRTWVNMAMAIRSEHGEDGFDVWDNWSRTADNYNASSAKSVWRSCRGHGVTMGSLFHEAKQRGWRDDSARTPLSPAQQEARRREQLARQTREGQEREQEAQKAAQKAGWIMHQTQQEQHAYLHSKGWPEAKGAVWHPDTEQNLLCIPMRIQGILVGVQMIDRHGAKKYLRGQRTSMAEYIISNEGRGCQDWFVEGYATGLSLRECLHALRLRYRIHICFSADNLVKVAAQHGAGRVIADHDASLAGQRAAQKTGLPYYLPPDVGQDFNDLHQALGTFKASQLLRQWLTA